MSYIDTRDNIFFSYRQIQQYEQYALEILIINASTTSGTTDAVGVTANDDDDDDDDDLYRHHNENSRQGKRLKQSPL